MLAATESQNSNSRHAHSQSG